MFLNNRTESVPNLGTNTVYHLAGGFNIGSAAGFDKAFHNKGLKQLKSHFLRKTALVHLKFRANYDNRTAGVVNTFTEKVLTETSLLTLKHIGKRF